MIRKLYLLASAIILGSWAQAQSFSIQQLQQLEADQLARSLDSASASAAIDFHGRFYKLEELQFTESDTFNWNFHHEELRIAVNLEQVSLRSGDTLFITGGDGRVHYITSEQNILNSWQSPYYNDELRLWMNRSGEPPFQIDGVILSRKTASDVSDFGNSAPCELNANCTEGDEFRDIQKSVVRISLRIGNNVGWCTGTLINNTNCDRTPFIYTAEHCAYGGSGFASASDFDKWRFYFNYEGEDCTNPTSESELNFQQISGAEVIARSDDNGGDYGSDFLLLRLTNLQAFQALGNVYFAGWNRTNIAPQNGITFHHPEGDIKKVSTFLSPAVSSTILNTPDTHWRLEWSATENGQGVTEPGSSGAPLIDQNKLIVGALTGGLASCNNPNQPDFYGKMSYSWNQNGSDPFNRLQPWLDPANTGAQFQAGIYKNDTSGCQPPESETFISAVARDGNLVLKTDGKSTATIQVFDLNGRQVRNLEIVPFPNIPQSIDVASLRAGIYILRLTLADETHVQKFLIY